MEDITLSHGGECTSNDTTEIQEKIREDAAGEYADWFGIETINDMRTHVPHHGAGRTTEQKTTSRCPRGSDIPLRHQQHETRPHH